MAICPDPNSFACLNKIWGNVSLAKEATASSSKRFALLTVIYP
jgi:hypothetical protein